ncbi:MAG: hypothetical protein K6F00_11120 [Lachnospiraceae bacterium]|nr:hypothetical protein [Lachnospiraceae bacterium]
MKRIENIFEEMDIYCKIDGKNVLVEFWTDTAGQDIPVEFKFDGTPESFVKEFTECAEIYDVDEEVELYANSKGEWGVPNTIRELLDDCQEAKDTLMEIARKLKAALNGEEETESTTETITITFNMEIDSTFREELEEIIDHKIESLVDLDSFPEIKSVYGCEIK